MTYGVLLPHPIRRYQGARMPWQDPRELPALWTPRQEYIWEKAVFTVPTEVSEERVQFAADKYKRRFGDALELQGFEVLSMEEPQIDTGLVAAGTTPPDRRAYFVWAKVRRRPEVITVDVPAEDEELFQEAGFSPK